MKPTETLRSGWMLDGTRIFMVFDETSGKYRLGTRWYWLASFDAIHDACDAFEVLEFCEHQEHSAIGTWVKREISRTPRCRSGRPNSYGRIIYLVRCVERRLSGQRLKRSGSKGSVEVWYDTTSPY